MKRQVIKQLILPVILFIVIVIFYFVKDGFFKPTTSFSFDEQEYQKCRQEGDHYFNQMHLYGWRQAAESYRRAYDMKKSPSLRRQLFLTLFLAATRERESGILNLSTYQKITALGDFSQDQKLHYLYRIINDYRQAALDRGQPGARQTGGSSEAETVDSRLFDIDDSPLDGYLYFYCVRHYRSAAFSSAEITQKYAQSPLFIFLNFEATEGREKEIEEKYPEFAEFFQYLGSRAYDRGKWSEASRYYLKALGLIPDYTAALNGMGNIYYYTVQDYDQAVKYYAQTLAIDSRDAVALYGEATALHYLGKYELANMTLDYLLARQDVRQGEAYYYKAYNYYRLQNFPAALEFADKARGYIPHSGDLNYLSGILFYHQGQIEQAKIDLLRSLEDGGIFKGEALFYISQIYREAGDPVSIDYLRKARAVMQETLEARKKEIDTIDSLDIQEEIKQWMKRDRMEKLETLATSFQSMIPQLSVYVQRLLENSRKNYEKAVKDGKNK